MFDINFNTLFTVQVLHEYYTDGICPDLIITPSADTQLALKENNMVWRQHINMLTIGMLTDPGDDTLPFQVLLPNQRLTFLLQSKNPLFFNFTDLPLEDVNGNVLYFTNRNNNLVGGVPYLSAPGSGGLVSASDFLLLTGNTFNYALSPSLASGTVDIKDFYTGTVVGSQNFTFAGVQNSVAVDLSALDTGKYVLSIAGQTPYTVYYCADFTGNNFCGVVDIFNDNTVPAAYRIFDKTTGKFTSPAFQISFPDRPTIWKYILLNGTTGSITDMASVYTFTGGANILTSTGAIPLNQTPLSLQLTYSGDTGPPVNIPSATAERLAAKDAMSGPFYYSEIYLNY
ncbi:MAG: hypothetical protein ACTHJ8_11410 [Mucilaginibacter sp.]